MSEEESAAVTPAGLAVTALFAAACLGFHWAAGWFPVLDSANLALHEAGHPLVGLLGWRAGVYGGTLFQLAFPLAAAWHFISRDHATGAAASTVWLGENLLNVARYMADARMQALPLIGGDHDWTEIFGRWGVLHLDTRIGGITRVIGCLLIVGAVGWLWRRWRAEA